MRPTKDGTNMAKNNGAIDKESMEIIADKAWRMRDTISSVMEEIMRRTPPGKQEFLTIKAWEGALMHEALAMKILQLISGCPLLPDKFDRSNELCRHVIDQIGEDITDIICKQAVAHIRIWALEEKEKDTKK